MRFRLVPLLTILSLLLCSTGFAQKATGEQEVMRVINAFMQAIDDRDVMAFDTLMVQNAYGHRIQITADTTLTSSRVLKGNFAEDQLKERFREGRTAITVAGHIAHVSGPYDFWINNKFSHCGYETFALIKENAGWKITSLTYSVETEGCDK